MTSSKVLADGQVVYGEHRLAAADGELTVVVLDDHGPGSAGPALAAIYGSPSNDCLVRIHSRCVYGEIFRSEECDCGAQLRTSIERILDEGAGIVIYLDQEGRGAGLAAKAEGYVLSTRLNVDSFEAYGQLGLKDDSRTYDTAAEFLISRGLSSVRLLTNNPEKEAALANHGIDVKAESLDVATASSANGYMASKKARGHRLA